MDVFLSNFVPSLLSYLNSILLQGSTYDLGWQMDSSVLNEQVIFVLFIE
jgi:hypothetical protein